MKILGVTLRKSLNHFMHRNPLFWTEYLDSNTWIGEVSVEPLCSSVVIECR